MTISSSGPVLTVDLAAVAENTRLFASRARGGLMAVVKADGFGHGATAVARTALANGATWLGVTSVGEAVSLRNEGVAARTLSWLNPVGADFERAIGHHVDLAASGIAHLRAMARAAGRVGLPAHVHLQIDLGMARDGAEPAVWPALCASARDFEAGGLVRVVGVMGHLGWADRPRDPSNATGAARFDAAVRTARDVGLRPALRHLAATAATLTLPHTHYDLCRVGAGLVGIDPSGTVALHPAMTLTAPVVDVRDVPAGTSVGYGHTYKTARATRLALIPVGYADGVPRAASARAAVQIGARRHRLAGLVSMDQIVVDVGAAPVRVGDVATVFGPGASGEPTVAEWARWTGTIEHEIVTGIGARIERRIVAEQGVEPIVVGANR